jgi:sugar phosphate isomerase/epimerase
MILVENHYGSAVIADAAAVVRAVDHPNCRALADWGNSAATSTAQRIADLSLLFPKLELVSAKGLHFDADYRHVDYDIGAIVRATEAAGFRGIYSIELWADQNPPDDPVRAAHTMLDTIAPLIINAAV